MKKIRDAQTMIGMFEDGELARDLGSEITDTLAKMKELSTDRPKGKIKGSVTLKLNFEMSGNSVTVTSDIDSKRPKAPRGESFYWAMDDGSLSTEHPQQTDMFAGPRAARTAETA